MALRRFSPFVRSFLPPAIAIVATAMSAAFVLQSSPRLAPLFLAARVVIFCWAGVRAVSVAGTTTAAAAAFGPILYFLDEVLLKGSCYLARAAASAGEDRQAMLAAAAGVLVTFAEFVVVPALISFGGGVFAKQRTGNRTATA